MSLSTAQPHQTTRHGHVALTLRSSMTLHPSSWPSSFPVSSRSCFRAFERRVFASRSNTLASAMYASSSVVWISTLIELWPRDGRRCGGVSDNSNKQ